MPNFTIKVIDGLSPADGKEWLFMHKTIDANNADDALDLVEEEIDNAHWPKASDYGVNVGHSLAVTIFATDGKTQAYRTIAYEAK